MILRLLKLIVFLFLIGVISTFISYTEGRTKIDWLGWGIDLETSHFIMILIFVSFFFILSIDCGDWLLVFLNLL